MHSIAIYVLVNLLTGLPVNIGCDTARFANASTCETAMTQFSAGVVNPPKLACRRIEVISP